MVDSEILNKDDRVELIRGEIIEMTAIESKYAACVNRLSNLLAWRLGNRVIVSVQNPVELDNNSEPEPDLVLLRSREDFYESAHP